MFNAPSWQYYSTNKIKPTKIKVTTHIDFSSCFVCSMLTLMFSCLQCSLVMSTIRRQSAVECTREASSNSTYSSRPVLFCRYSLVFLTLKSNVAVCTVDGIGADNLQKPTIIWCFPSQVCISIGVCGVYITSATPITKQFPLCVNCIKQRRFTRSCADEVCGDANTAHSHIGNAHQFIVLFLSSCLTML